MRRGALAWLALVPLIGATAADLVGVITRTPFLWRIGSHLEIVGVAAGSLVVLAWLGALARRRAGGRPAAALAAILPGLALFALAWWVRGDAAIPPDPALLLAEPIAALLVVGGWGVGAQAGYPRGRPERMTTEGPGGRLFLAVPLAGEARAALASELRRHPPLPGRPVPPASWHLTLRFLGDTSGEARARLREEIGRAALGDAFTIRFGGYGAFPRPARASVVWLGVAEGAEPLAALAREAEAAARRAGFPPEGRPFRPHLTLSRLRGPQDVSPALRGLPPFALSLPVGEVVLFRSQLGGGPARYEALDRFPLS